MPFPAPRSAALHGPRLGGLLLMLLGLWLPGCGDRDADGGRVCLVRIVGSPRDGPPPTSGLRVRHVAQGQPVDAYELVPEPGQPPGTYRVPGAPEGMFLLEMPQGWGMLSRMGLPRLQADGQATVVRVGRTFALYLVSGYKQRPLGETWGLRRVTPGRGLAESLPLEVLPDDDGYTILRLRPQDWTGGLALQGRFADGGLTEQVLLQPKERGLPIYRVMQGEPLAPLEVAVVGAAAAADPAAAPWVRARVLGLPIEEVQRAPLRDGVARFAGLSTTGEGVEVLPDESTPVGALLLPPGGWMREGELRLRAPPGPLARAVRLSLPAGEAVEHVQLRRQGEDSYGRVPFRVSDGQIEVSAEPGAWRALVRTAAGFRAAAFELPAESPAPAPGPVELGLPSAPVTVRGRVEGLEAGRLAWQLEEEGLSVLAHGFVAAVRRGGSYEALLPAGTYRLVLTAPDGSRDATRRHTFEAGTLVSLDLDRPGRAPEPR